MKTVQRCASIAIVAAVFGGVAVSTTPASASTSSGYISGTGEWGNDWADEGPISASSYAHSNAAAMWQTILWADGLLSYSGIDCRFGGTTTTATKNWQQFVLGPEYADGVVGPQTLSTAAIRLSVNSAGQYVFDGWSHYVTFTRNSDGQWGMYIGSDHHLLSYTYANFDACS